MLTRILVALAFQSGISLAAPAIAAAPTVRLDNATVTGVSDESTSKFLGIPYALPPYVHSDRCLHLSCVSPSNKLYSFLAIHRIRDLRFRLPVANAPYTTNFAAKDFGKSCPQQTIDLPIVSGLLGEAMDYITNTIFGFIFPDDEDCLTVNVVAPARIPAGTKLLVVAWIFGGGFELGSTSINSLHASLSKGDTFWSAFGFLPGKEVKEAGVGNLGLQDQRRAFRWIQRYIGSFGGDPTKVTIWGESAGAISAALHMVANNGDTEGLFGGSFMQTGSPIPVGDITNGQKYYDALVTDTGCSGSADTLECLRTVPYSKLKSAVNKSPGIFSYQITLKSWCSKGKVANIPFITDDCDDEGTLFSLSNLNVTTDSELKSNVINVFLPGISDGQVNRVAELYSNNILAGSPFEGMILINFTAHASDILNIYAGGELADYLIRFVVNLDPNGSGTPSWPRYTTSSPRMMTFTDSWFFPTEISKDDYRKDALKYVTELTMEIPI